MFCMRDEAADSKGSLALRKAYCIRESTIHYMCVMRNFTELLRGCWMEWHPLQHSSNSVDNGYALHAHSDNIYVYVYEECRQSAAYARRIYYFSAQYLFVTRVNVWNCMCHTSLCERVSG